MLTKLMFISLVLFQFGCFTLSVEASKWLTPKIHEGVDIIIGTPGRLMYSCPTISYVNCAKRVLFVLNMHSCPACWIAAQYVARVLHFSAFSLKRLYTCVCVPPLYKQTLTYQGILPTKTSPRLSTYSNL